MAWEDEAKALERHLEVTTALQREMIDALLRVAEKYNVDPVQLAMGAQNMHGLFQPLFQLQQERMWGQQQAAQQPPKIHP